MRTLVLLLAVPVTIAAAQEAAPPAPAQPAAAAAQAVEKTVEQTASPELVGQLVNELGITPNQAQGAAGTLFGVAKGRLAPADFAKVAAAVPNMDGLLAAVPAAGSGSALDALTAKAGGMTAAAGTLSKLGLKTDTVMKLA